MLEFRTTITCCFGADPENDGCEEADDLPQDERTEKRALVVVDTGDGRLAVVDPSSGETSLRRPEPFANIGHRTFIAESNAAQAFAVIDPWQPFVAVFSRVAKENPDAKTKAEPPRRIAVATNPQALAFTPKGRQLLVACDPPGRADRPVCFVDLTTGAVSQRMIPGSSNLRGIAVDPQGTFALAVHLVPKSDLPATQIEQGWVFTNAVSFVPLDDSRPVITLPLDQRTQGFANPEGIAIAPDGKRAYVAHAGADVVSVIDLAALVRAADELGGTERRKTEARAADAGNANGQYRSDDLRLTRKYVRARIAVGASPRGIAVSTDSRFVGVVNRLDDSISIIDSELNSVTRTIALPPTDVSLRNEKIRSGEKLFQSGKLAFSGQFSCASCHPDGQSDGLNWDLPADGFNNFHNTKTLLGTSGTAPYGWTGTSPDLRERFTGTLRHLFQHEPTEEERGAMEAYLAQLDYPAALPPRVEPKSAAVQRGLALFRGVARCSDCHSGTKLTDRMRHDVGTGSTEVADYDTPSLVRVVETAPYLHDGRAETLSEIFTRYNPTGLHGDAADLSPERLADLVEYLKSL